MNKREPAINGDEQDWTSRWRRVLCVFANNTGLGKKVKRKMNKRERRRANDLRHLADEIADDPPEFTDHLEHEHDRAC
jgi:hypothetical protein